MKYILFYFNIIYITNINYYGRTNEALIVYLIVLKLFKYLFGIIYI